MNNTTLTPAQRAALAEAREADAQRRKYASATAPVQNANQITRAPQAERQPMRQGQGIARTASAVAQRPPIRNAQAPSYAQNPSRNANAQSRAGHNTKEYPKASALRPANANKNYTTNKQAEQKEDTGEFPSYVRATKKGGYRPARAKQRHVTKIHRRKFDPHFKAALLAIGALLAIILILLIFGVRYSVVTLKSDGSTVRFFGTAKDGEPYNGWLSYSTGEKGNLKDGNTITYSDGSVYKGPTDDGLRTGKGTIKYKNGEYKQYDGTFADNKMNGYGVMVYKNGDKYEGSFVNDKCEGTGTMTYSDGSVYVGEFKNNRKNGYGVMTYANGDQYEGNFVGDIKNGHGIMIYANGDKYEGNFKNDMRNGYGFYYFAALGDTYEGNFKNSEMSGEGTYKWATGKVYTGMFENGKPVE